MVAGREFTAFFVLIAAAVYITAQRDNSTQNPFPEGSGNITDNETEIIPCEEMNCTEGTCCQLGKQICPPMWQCFNRPTECQPFSGNETSNSTLGDMGNNTVLCPASSEEGSGWDGEGSALDEYFERGNCSSHMYSATCGPDCPQDCTGDYVIGDASFMLEAKYAKLNTGPKCLSISCSQEERCFCIPGYVLLKSNDTASGCVLKKDCPH
ncbi:hypothetical protein OESDEN_07164 [Oesophagostomum dentatum]|uniref:Trypsin Inhibitor like cysteine rich domain protein n=1 Tax=Oesophagostomum dentatum TaxID=61180 RepID=A0A0B1TAU8_OESDE|nr:hypothetical protein OESDEN_07164 [Oesophagostomum dentatum]